MLLSDLEIKDLSLNHAMITPYFDKSINKDEQGNKIPSYGSSSYGYDVRIGRNFKIFAPPIPFQSVPVVDVCDFAAAESQIVAEKIDVDFIIIPPRGFVLGHTLERIVMPRDVSAIAMGKSTLARCGCSVMITPIEAGWSGYITIEIANLLHMPMKIKAGTGICQLMFLKGNPCETSYSERGGKYEDQPALPICPR